MARKTESNPLNGSAALLTKAFGAVIEEMRDEIGEVVKNEIAPVKKNTEAMLNLGAKLESQVKNLDAQVGVDRSNTQHQFTEVHKTLGQLGNKVDKLEKSG